MVTEGPEETKCGIELKGPQDESSVTGHVLFSSRGLAMVTQAGGLGFLGFVIMLLFEKRFDGQESINCRFESKIEYRCQNSR